MKKTLVTILLLLILSPHIGAQWLWDINTLQEVKKNVNTLTYASAYRLLMEEAEQKLKEGVYSVTDKSILPASGDVHDYMSLSRYWWPDPTKSDGLPYINKDGQSNPELNKYDRNPLGNMCSAVNTLSLAYFFTQDERYAQKAVQLLRTWFLDKKTKMNPNLNYSQVIPGRYDSKGRPEGLIDTYSFVEMLNSVQLLKDSKHFTNADNKGLKQWFADFSVWWQTSEQAKDEANKAKNNHSVSYDVQLVAYSLFAGDLQTATRVIDEFPERRLFKQIEPDGKQPNELWRTLAFGYSEYNIRHMIDMFAMAKQLNRELYKVQSADGRSFYKAVDYLTSYLGKDVSEWPYKQISGWDEKQQELCEDLYRIVVLDPSQQDYLILYKTYNKQPFTDRNRLLYGAADPIEEVFSFAAKQFNYAFVCIDNTLASTTKKNAVNPRSIDKNGNLEMVTPRDWCSGFFPGSLWFMYEYTKDAKWREKADKHSRLIEGEKHDRTSHDVGFKMYNSFGNGYKLTNDEAYKNVVIQSAKTLSERFNPKIGSIRSWDWNRNTWQFPVIIDNMMNLELLFEASKLTGNPVYHNIADKHAQTTLKNHFRDDYSSYHVVDYDTISGKAIKKQTHQGYSDPSAWTRGQAWGLYGFTMSYRYTHNADFLAQAEGIANFIFTHPNLPSDFIPYWDFNDSAIPNAPRDASAASITASALYELAEYSDKNRIKYITLADKILENLIHSYKVQPQTTQGFLLLHSTGHLPGKSEIDVPICYADYYFLEALLRRKNLQL